MRGTLQLDHVQSADLHFERHTQQSLSNTSHELESPSIDRKQKAQTLAGLF